ncbi:MAG: hypothetical protein H6817_01395 [Phycisphaerales bacterium]|nr:hypothetical protein [Phycisphaerales bacterium]
MGSRAVPILYGLHSPFDTEERAAIEQVYSQVCASDHPDAQELAGEVRHYVSSLENLGDILARYPSPRASQTLGSRERGLHTLVETLSHATPANFEFLLPTRALIGRALAMAESNFYRFLRHVCDEVLAGAERDRLRARVIDRMHACMYTKLIEEVLSALASDHDLDHEVRSRAVAALSQIWDRRLTYRVRDFFPILEATWNARQKITVVGGTLSGTHEMFALFQAGCDARFVDFFAAPEPSTDEIEAFREFLFGTSSEELEQLSKDMAASGATSISVTDQAVTGGQDGVTVFYSFFRMRHLQATARRMMNTPGPKRTAEAYVLIAYLMQAM